MPRFFGKEKSPPRNELRAEGKTLANSFLGGRVDPEGLLVGGLHQLGLSALQDPRPFGTGLDEQLSALPPLLDDQGDHDDREHDRREAHVDGEGQSQGSLGVVGRVQEVEHGQGESGRQEGHEHGCARSVPLCRLSEAVVLLLVLADRVASCEVAGVHGAPLGWGASRMPQRWARTDQNISHLC